MAERRKKNRLVWVLAAAPIVVVVLLVARRGHGPTVPVISVVRETINESIPSNGEVEPIAPFIARAEFPTFVDKVLATEGQAVRSGELILSLSAADVRATLARTNAELLAAQADLAHARAGGPPEDRVQLDADLQAARAQQADLARSHQELTALLKEKATTVDAVAQNEAQLIKANGTVSALEEKQKAMQQNAELAVKSDTLQIEQDAATIQALQRRVCSATVLSPLNGTLYSLPLHAGDYVQTGDALARMADLRHVRVRAYVDEPDLGHLEVNERVEVTWDAKPEQTWEGRTESVPKQVVKLGDRNVGEVLCSVDNSQLQLLPGVNVEVRIFVRQSRASLVIPRAAIQYDSKGQHYVWVLSGKQVERRNISVGIASPTLYEVLGGLREGELVALPGQRKLQDGMSIRPTEAQ